MTCEHPYEALNRVESGAVYEASGWEMYQCRCGQPVVYVPQADIDSRDRKGLPRPRGTVVRPMETKSGAN